MRQDSNCSSLLDGQVVMLQAVSKETRQGCDIYPLYDFDLNPTPIVFPLCIMWGKCRLYCRSGIIQLLQAI